MRLLIQAIGAKSLASLCKGRIEHKINYHFEELKLVDLIILCKVNRYCFHYCQILECMFSNLTIADL